MHIVFRLEVRRRILPCRLVVPPSPLPHRHRSLLVAPCLKHARAHHSAPRLLARAVEGVHPDFVSGTCRADFSTRQVYPQRGMEMGPTFVHPNYFSNPHNNETSGSYNKPAAVMHWTQEARRYPKASGSNKFHCCRRPRRRISPRSTFFTLMPT